MSRESHGLSTSQRANFRTNGSYIQLNILVKVWMSEEQNLEKCFDHKGQKKVGKGV